MRIEWRKPGGHAFRKNLFAHLLVVSWIRHAFGQVEFAPANMGLRLAPQDGYVKAVPGRNPNVPAWIEDLGVESFGEIISMNPGAISSVVSKADEIYQAESRALRSTFDHSKYSEDGFSNDGQLISGNDANQILDRSSESLDYSSSTTVGRRTFGDSEEIFKANTEKGIVYPSISAEEMLESVGQRNSMNSVELPLGPRRSTLPSSPSDLLIEKAFLPPPKEALEVECPKHTISLWRPQPTLYTKGPMFILPADNEIVQQIQNIDTFRPIIATSTIVTKIAGQIVTTETVMTLDEKAFKFKSCIYGCPEMTSSDSLIGTTTIITILPLQVPCSLISCPPCPACFSSTVKVSVCPFLSTVSGKEKTMVVNGPTITVVRSTVTRTKCTSTKTITAKDVPCTCPSEPASTTTVTIVEKAFGDHLKNLLFVEQNETFSVSLQSPTISIMEMLGSIRPASSGDAEEFVFVTTSEKLETSTTVATVFSPTSTSKRLPSITITRTVIAQKDTKIITVTTTVIPVTTPEGPSNSGVCSTFIICNPTQFTCPAQVTNLPQIKAVVQSIMDGYEKFGSAGVISRGRTSNGAFVDDVAKLGAYGDGSQLMGGLAPINAFGFGPGGMFEKVLGTDMIKLPYSEPDVTLFPDQPKSTSSTSSETVASSVTISEVNPTDEPIKAAANIRHHGVKSGASTLSSSWLALYIGLPLGLLLCLNL